MLPAALWRWPLPSSGSGPGLGQDMPTAPELDLRGRLIEEKVLIVVAVQEDGMGMGLLKDGR